MIGKDINLHNLGTANNEAFIFGVGACFELWHGGEQDVLTIGEREREGFLLYSYIRLLSKITQVKHDGQV